MSTEAASSSGGSILTRKTGPLANWMWMALLLLVALVYSMWKRNRAAAVPVDEEQTVTEPLPGDQTPPPIFILPQNPQPSVPININLPPAPVPRPVPPTPPHVPPIGSRPPAPPKPVPKPGPPPKPVPVTYVPVKVVKYTDPPGSAGPAWNSTLWGIAKHYGLGSAGNNYASIWNDPKNAALRQKRGTPTKVQPGDTIYVRR